MSFFEGSNDITIRGGTFIAQHTDSKQRAFDLLTSKASPSAFHMADEDVFHSACLPNTRVGVLEQLKSWANLETMSNTFILWLRGAAGGGKTAIARTIAQWCQNEGILLGEFFFSRTDGGRDHIGSLAATLAYRMATLTLPAAKDVITRAVAHDPHVFSASLADQMTRLVLAPLDLEAQHSIVPHVIILDGLDECLSDVEQDLVLNVLSGTLHKLNPELRILICSRPEPVISTAFMAPRLHNISARLSLNDGTDSNADIHTFLVQKFAILKQLLPHPPSDVWPEANDINYLVRKSSGQFIFAATVVKYVSSPRHRHNAVMRLRHILDLKQLPPNAKQHPFAELDALYSLILSTRELEEVEITAKATAICFEYPRYFKAVSIPDLSRILQFELTRVRAMLDELASLFEVTADDNIRPFHVSLVDFLYERSRSGKFYCNQKDVVAEIACALLRRGRDPDVLSFDILAHLLEDVSPNKNLQAILTQLEPSSIFSGSPFNGVEDINGAYHLIPVLRQLRKHVPLQTNQKLVTYFDRNFASHVTGLYDESKMPELQSVSNHSGGDYDDADEDEDDNDDDDDDDDFESDSSLDLPHVRPKSDESLNDGDDHRFRNSDHLRKALNSPLTLDRYSVYILATLSALPAWDEVVISRGLHISPSEDGESLRSICYEAPFVRSHLPQTLSVLLQDSNQGNTAYFCLSKLKARSTPQDHFQVFANLLPDSLSRAAPDRILTRAVNTLAKKRQPTYNRLPSKTKDAITAYYVALDQTLPTSNIPPPASSTSRQTQTSATPSSPNTLHQSSARAKSQRSEGTSQQEGQSAKTYTLLDQLSKLFNHLKTPEREE